MPDTPPSPAPAVSVVIPAYNRAASIKVSIESVLRQSYADFELLVVDDCSTDATVAVAAGIADPRIRLLANPRNMGAGGARNTGLAAARGTWVAFQDSDDEWLPSKLEKQMARLTAPGAPYVAAYCGMLILGGLDPRPGARLETRYVPDPAIARVDGDILVSLLGTNLISTQTLVARRDLLERIGGFDEATTPIEDWDCVLQLAQLGPIAFVDEPLVLQRFSPNSITRLTARRLTSLARLLDKHRELFARHPAELAGRYYVLAGGLRRQGDVAGARRYLAEARRLKPADPRLWAMSLYAAAQGLKRG